MGLLRLAGYPNHTRHPAWKEYPKKCRVQRPNFWLRSSNRPLRSLRQADEQISSTMSNDSVSQTHSASQTYLSTRSGEYGVRHLNMLHISTAPALVMSPSTANGYPANFSGLPPKHRPPRLAGCPQILAARSGPGVHGANVSGGRPNYRR